MMNDEITASVEVYLAGPDAPQKHHNPIKPGLMIITEGMYSNYSVHGVFRVLKQIDDPDALQARFTWAEYVVSSPYTCLHTEEMVDYLLKEGFIEEVAHHEWHLT